MRAAWIISVVLLTPLQAVLADLDERLLLAGGALPVCSSFSPIQCKKRHFSDNYRSGALYQLDAQSAARLQTASDPELKRLALLVAAYSQDKQTTLRGDRRAIRQALAGVALSRSGASVGQDMAAFGLEEYQKRFAEDPVVLTGESWWQRVADDTLASALSVLEVAQQRADGRRKQEGVDIADSRNRHAVEVFETFVDMARARSEQSSPLILVSTASSTDSFEVVDFYTAVFAQLGARSRWLPLDRVLQAALEQSRCDALNGVREEVAGLYNRARIYPDLAERQQTICDGRGEVLLALLDQADGLFLNGGDQSLTRAAWYTSEGKPTAWLQRLRKRFQEGELAVGGTSAGTAVQAGPNAAMVSNGSAEGALLAAAQAMAAPVPGCERAARCQGVDPDTLTYQPAGGIGLFGLGLIDTHFSEREREWRMMALAGQTGAEQAWGVDETTALVMASAEAGQRLRVVGERGVWRLHAMVPGITEKRLGQCVLGPGRVDYLTAPASWRLPAARQASTPVPESCFDADARSSDRLLSEVLASELSQLQTGQVLAVEKTLARGVARWCWYADQHSDTTGSGYRNLNAALILQGSPLCIDAR
jgi:cyanophycinase